MTWPTSAVVTTNLDQGTDEPRLARVELKQAVDNINSIAAEFGNVNTVSSTNDQVLVKSGNVWIGSNTITNLDLLDFDTTSAVTPTAGQLTWDGAQGTLAFGVTNNIVTRIGQDMFANVTNAESVTITKGQPVYHFGATGDRASVKLALNTSDATSAKTFGIAAESITAGGTGMIMTQGILDGLNLGSYTAGDTLYLGATAGTVTATKPYAPNHMVYLGTVSRANNGNGIMFVKIQNGYELNEIHDVNISTPITGQVLQYSGNVWINANVASGGSSLQFAILNSGLNISAAVASATPIPANWTEEIDDNSIVSVGGTDTREFTLGSGTYMLELSGLTITAALPAGAANAANPSGDLFIYLREVGDTVDLATSTHPGWSGPGNGSSIAYVVDMGNPQFAKKLVVTTSTSYQLVYTANTRDKTIRRLTLKITKTA